MSERLPCPIRGCDHTRPPEHAFCVQHWRAVPDDLKRDVHATWQMRRRARGALTAASRTARERTGAAVPRDHELRTRHAQAMREHLQALENAQAAVEGRPHRDLFAGLGSC